MAIELIDMFVVFANCLAQVFGGMAAAALLGWSSWQIFKLVRRPHIGPWMAMLTLFAIPGAARRPFVQMMMMFLAIGALALIPVGRSWREQDRLRRILRRLAKSATNDGPAKEDFGSERADQLSQQRPNTPKLVSMHPRQ